MGTVQHDVIAIPADVNLLPESFSQKTKVDKVTFFWFTTTTVLAAILANVLFATLVSHRAAMAHRNQIATSVLPVIEQRDFAQQKSAMQKQQSQVVHGMREVCPTDDALQTVVAIAEACLHASNKHGEESLQRDAPGTGKGAVDKLEIDLVEVHLPLAFPTEASTEQAEGVLAISDPKVRIVANMDYEASVRGMKHTWLSRLRSIDRIDSEDFKVVETQNVFQNLRSAPRSSGNRLQINTREQFQISAKPKSTRRRP